MESFFMRFLQLVCCTFCRRSGKNKILIVPLIVKTKNFDCSFAFVSCCAIPIIFYPKKLFRNQSILYLSIKYLLYFIGGTPYPGVKGRDVHSLLKEGYRIEKPRHVNKELYVYLFLNIQ